jgi:hypothetical protein
VRTLLQFGNDEVRCARAHGGIVFVYLNAHVYTADAVRVRIIEWIVRGTLSQKQPS